MIMTCLEILKKGRGLINKMGGGGRKGGGNKKGENGGEEGPIEGRG